MPALLVRHQKNLFAIPQVNTLQILRIGKNEISTRLRRVQNELMIEFLGELIPVVSLEEVFRQGNTCPKPNEKNFGLERTLPVVILTDGHMNFGLIVDEAMETQEIVIKPLGVHFSSIDIYGGATILGNGKVAPILNSAGIVNHCSIREYNIDEDDEDDLEKLQGYQDVHEQQHLLIACNAGKEKLAIPMHQVRRIERINAKDIDKVGELYSCRIDSGNLPLFYIEQAAGLCTVSEEDTYQIIIFDCCDRQLGLCVNKIIDSLDTEILFEESVHKQAAIHGSALIRDELTLLVDLYSLVTTVIPQWKISAQTGDEGPPTVLVVDDSKFFVKRVSQCVADGGYRVITAADGEEAWEVLQGDMPIDLLLTDLEMPRLDGWGLAKRCRADGRFKKLPIIAVTSVAGTKAEQRGKEAGIDIYLAKLDPEEILKHLSNFLKQEETHR